MRATWVLSRRRRPVKNEETGTAKDGGTGEQAPSPNLSDSFLSVPSDLARLHSGAACQANSDTRQQLPGLGQILEILGAGQECRQQGPRLLRLSQIGQDLGQVVGYGRVFGQGLVGLAQKLQGRDRKSVV